jgi:hypothetical protein
MLISHSKKFIFVHILKTGGKSITNTLYDYISIDLNNSKGKEKIDPSIKSLMELIDDEIMKCTSYPQLKPRTKTIINYIFSNFDRQEMPEPLKVTLKDTLGCPKVFGSIYRSFINENYPKIYSSIHSHEGGRDVKKMLPAEIFKDYFKFSFVRNPLDWLVSIFFFFSQYETESYHQFFKSFRGFDEFIEFLVTQSKKNFAGLDFFGCSFKSPQRDFLYDEEGNLLVDYVGKFENIEHDFAEVCKIIGIPPVKLPHIDKSDHKNYLECYTPETKQLIYSILKEDFETFHYENF